MATTWPVPPVAGSWYAERRSAGPYPAGGCSGLQRLGDRADPGEAGRERGPCRRARVTAPVRHGAG